MHIPDGYLSPATSGAMYVVSAPFWYFAVNRVRKVVTHRTVPVLASFAIVLPLVGYFIHRINLRRFYYLWRNCGFS
jgi:ABC-type Co2+ transport system permease subunit